MAKKIKRRAESWRYVLVSDRDLPVDEQSTWILNPLTQAQRAEVQDNMVRVHNQPDGGQTFVSRPHRMTLDLCLTNIASVENFPAGAAVPWPSGRDERAAYLEGLDDAYVHELGNEIYAQAILGDDIKN
jgi:hypothetical protein